MESGTGARGGSEPEAPLLAGRYRVIERIGAGGMAVVSLAEDTRLGRRVAIKRLHADSPDDAAQRFLREAKLGAALSHPNLVTVFDAFADGPSLVIVMEHIAGPDLGVALRSGPLEQREGLRVLADVAAALDHTHAAGIIHRDVKPSNVLLAPDGSARLTDLGIARVLEDTQTTQVGVVVGSTPYMSPEQLRGEGVGRAADVYALALTAYEVLSGEPARRGMPAQIIYQTTEAPPPDIREVRPETPAAAAEVLKGAMALRPEQRPASAGDLVAELEGALGAATAATRPAERPAPPMPPPREVPTESRPAEPVRAPAPAPAATPASPPPARRGAAGRRLALGLAALLALAVAAIAIVSLGDDGTDEPGPVAAESETTTEEPKPEKDKKGTEGVAAAAGTPEAAVQDFYELAASGDYDGAAALLTPAAEGQLGGVSSFPGSFDSLETIEFPTLETSSEAGAAAQVELASVATHTDYVDECSGTVSMLAEGDAWLIDSFGVECVRTG